jgi:hypothetical protein
MIKSFILVWWHCLWRTMSAREHRMVQMRVFIVLDPHGTTGGKWEYHFCCTCGYRAPSIITEEEFHHAFSTHLSRPSVRRGDLDCDDDPA